ncbi:MAG: cysteine synthase A [Clostridia bacterium]|nr:cysteine synthase A [Clostridia bacterium]
MKIHENIISTIGSTPLVRLNRFFPQGNLIAKLEYFNPAGSAKDRVAASMIADAESKGLLKSGAVIIEPTSGNTGIGLAAVGASKGYRVILTMPDTMSVERRRLLSAYGAEIVLTDGKLGMAGAIAEAERLSEKYENAFIAGQFDNPSNPDAHYKTTGSEIWADTDGKVDIFVAGIGTGGTLSGTGKYLKEKNPNIKIVGFEPSSSPLITEGKSGAHGLQGIGANFVPKNYDSTVCDEVVTVTEADAFAAARDLARKEGFLVGISSGAALVAASKLARENPDKTVVTLLPDSGERYLSTGIFD